MTRRLGWWVLVMLGAMSSVFFLLTTMKYLFPPLFPTIQGPPTTIRIYLVVAFLVVSILVTKFAEPAMRRNALMIDAVNGAIVGLFLFILGLVA